MAPDMFNERSWPFTPPRIKAAIKFARESNTPRYVWRDDGGDAKHLHLIVGRRSAAFYYRAKKNGRVVEHRLGDAEGPASLSLDEARTKCNQRHYGADIKQTRKGKTVIVGVTTDEIWERYLDEVTAGTFSMRGAARPLKEKTRIGYESNYNCHIQPGYGSKDFGKFITDAPDLIRSITRTSKALNNQVLAVARALVKYARRRNIYDGHDPLRDDDESLRAYVPGREVNLTMAQIRKLRAAIENQPPYWSDLFSFLVLTSRRLSNATELKWDQVDFESGEILYPSTTMKTSKPSPVAMTKEVRAILKRRLKDVPKGSPYVWPQQKNPNKPVDNPYDHWAELRTQAGLPDLVIHGLRHLAVTIASKAKNVPSGSAGTMASHSDPQTTAKYQHFDSEAARPALEAVAKVWTSAKKKS